jgi:hypothetical protein
MQATGSVITPTSVQTLMSTGNVKLDEQGSPQSLLSPGTLVPRQTNGFSRIGATVGEVLDRVPMYGEMERGKYDVDLTSKEGRAKLHQDVQREQGNELWSGNPRLIERDSSSSVKLSGTRPMKIDLPPVPTGFLAGLKDFFSFLNKDWSLTAQHAQAIREALPDIRESARQAMLKGGVENNKLYETLSHYSERQICEGIAQQLKDVGLNSEGYETIGKEFGKCIYDGLIDGASAVLEKRINKSVQEAISSIESSKTGKADMFFNYEKSTLESLRSKVWMQSGKFHMPESFNNELTRMNSSLDEMEDRLDEMLRTNPHQEGITERVESLREGIQNLRTEAKLLEKSFNETRKILYSTQTNSLETIQNSMVRMMGDTKLKSGDLENAYGHQQKLVLSLQKQLVELAKAGKIAPSHFEDAVAMVDEMAQRVEQNYHVKKTLVEARDVLKSGDLEQARKLQGDVKNLITQYRDEHGALGVYGDQDKELLEEVLGQALKLNAALGERIEILQIREKLGEGLKTDLAKIRENPSTIGEVLQKIEDSGEALRIWETKSQSFDLSEVGLTSKSEGLPPRDQVIRQARQDAVREFLGAPRTEDSMRDGRLDSIIDNLHSKGLLTTELLGQIKKAVAEGGQEAALQLLGPLHPDSTSFSQLIALGDQLYPDSPDDALALKLRMTDPSQHAEVKNLHSTRQIEDNLKAISSNETVMKMLGNPKSNEAILQGLANLARDHITSVTSRATVDELHTLAEAYGRLKKGELLPDEQLSRLVHLSKTVAQMEIGEGAFDQSRANRLLEQILTTLNPEIRDIHDPELGKQISQGVALDGSVSPVVKELNGELKKLDDKLRFAEEGISLLEDRLHDSLTKLAPKLKVGSPEEARQKILTDTNLRGDLENLTRMMDAAEKLEGKNLTKHQREMYEQVLSDCAKDLKYFDPKDLKIKEPGLFTRIFDILAGPPPSKVAEDLRKKGGGEMVEAFVSVWKDLSTVEALRRSIHQFKEGYSEIVKEKESLIGSARVYMQEKAIQAAIIAEWRDSGEALSTFSPDTGKVLERLKQWGVTEENYPELRSKIESLELSEENIVKWENSAPPTELQAKWEKFEKSVHELMGVLSGSDKVSTQFDEARRQMEELRVDVSRDLSHLGSLNESNQLTGTTQSHGTKKVVDVMGTSIGNVRNQIDVLSMGSEETGDAVKARQALIQLQEEWEQLAIDNPLSPRLDPSSMIKESLPHLLTLNREKGRPLGDGVVENFLYRHLKNEAEEILKEASIESPKVIETPKLTRGERLKQAKVELMEARQALDKARIEDSENTGEISRLEGEVGKLEKRVSRLSPKTRMAVIEEPPQTKVGESLHH